MSTGGLPPPRPAALTVVSPGGNRSSVPLDPLPFTIGRQTGNSLVLRDNRASRQHAQILWDGSGYILQDLQSSHGTSINGHMIERQRLRSSDRIEFGIPDSYQLIFNPHDVGIHQLMNRWPESETSAGGPPTDLSRLRSLVDVARALQHSLSLDEVLNAVLDAALTITGFQRAYLLMNQASGGMEVRLARDRDGWPVDAATLPVAPDLIRQELLTRHDLLEMSCERLPPGQAGGDVVCVPLLRIRTNSAEETRLLSAKDDTVGALFLDEPQGSAGLAKGSHELLQTLAVEASTVLENARLLEEERSQQRLKSELAIARDIQTSLLPKSLPTEGWFRASGSSIAASEVGGDSFDVREVCPDLYCFAITDVSGKGISSALLAALMHGAFFAASPTLETLSEMGKQLNRFLFEKTGGEKYVTGCYCLLARDGRISWTNAGHCEPIVIKAKGGLEELQTTGLPLGMMEISEYETGNARLENGDVIIFYTDGVTEARGGAGEFFGVSRLRDVAGQLRGLDATDVHGRLMDEISTYTGGAALDDDITWLVVQYLDSPP